MSGTLLAIDGDSLAHRAYHALPKSIRFNALVGFANFLMRLWEAEQPESVLVAWDSLETPTYRHQALPAYQSGREFEPSILEQLGMLPALVESFGFAVAKAGGYEADDFLAAASQTWTGTVLVATSDRDAFQLVNDRVTILQPVKGVSELARIGIAEVRERYGVEPGAGAGLHRAPRRPIGQDPRRPRRRPEESSRHPEAARLVARRRSPTAASHRSPTSSSSTATSRRWTPRRRCRSSRTRRPTGSAPPRTPRSSGWGTSRAV